MSLFNKMNKALDDAKRFNSLNLSDIINKAASYRYDGATTIILTKEEYIDLYTRGMVSESDGLGKFQGLEIIKE